MTDSERMVPRYDAAKEPGQVELSESEKGQVRLATSALAAELSNNNCLQRLSYDYMFMKLDLYAAAVLSSAGVERLREERTEALRLARDLANDLERSQQRAEAISAALDAAERSRT